MDLKDLKQLITDEDILAIDLKYIGLDGIWYHITFPSRRLDYVIEHGVSFDGSSIPGMRAVESGDMVLMPDLSSAHIDPLTVTPTIRILCSICDAASRIGVKKDPRSVAKRAQEYMISTGIADTSLWIPELEFHLFNSADYYNGDYDAGYSITSSETKDSLPEDMYDGNALSQQHAKGYHMDTPFDQHYELRQEMVEIMEELGIQIRYHHHEVGLSAQQEIETEMLSFPKICDDVMLMKDVIRRLALRDGLTATFMPKPAFNQAGNGMHFHMLLTKQGKNIFYKKGGYADLSPEALWFIGGILKHGCSLVAFTNPSTNSYKRLLPGFEAPVKLIFGLANRSAAIRIPKYATTKDNKRFEFRTGDGTCNPYLAMSALLMAGLDGIKNKIDPTKLNYGPFDDNIFEWSSVKKEQLVSIPSTLKEALEALQADHDYLLAGNVFNEEMIMSHIDLKMKEHEMVSSRPHPFEMSLYYNI